MLNKRIPVTDRPLTSDEMNDRMFQMMQQRAEQDAKVQKRFTLFGKNVSTAPKPIIDRLLTSDEVNERMFRMMQERAYQDALETRQQYNKFPAPGY